MGGSVVAVGSDSEEEKTKKYEDVGAEEIYGERIYIFIVGSFQIPVDSFNEPLAVIRWRSQP